MLVTDYVETARKRIGSRDEQRHISQLQHGDLELFLCMEGYGSLYEGYVAPDKQVNVTAPHGTLAYWKQVTDGQINRTKDSGRSGGRRRNGRTAETEVSLSSSGKSSNSRWSWRRRPEMVDLSSLNANQLEGRELDRRSTLGTSRSGVWKNQDPHLPHRPYCGGQPGEALSDFGPNLYQQGGIRDEHSDPRSRPKRSQ